MFVGYPASAKGTLAKSYAGYIVLNRDSVGGSVLNLVPKMVNEIKAGHDVVLDNTHAVLNDRTPFIQAAKNAKANIHCIWLDTSIEDCQINALMRMWERYGKIFFDDNDLKAVAGDDNMFPPAVLFSFRKRFEKPNIDEGFSTLTRQKFVRHWPADFNGKGLFLDYDSTLRRTLGGGKWPTDPSQIEILPKRTKVLQRYLDQDYKLFGISNQSGIGAGTMTEAQAIACFDHTNEQLGLDIEYRYCPHRPGPIGCYCRKPQVGMLIHFICKYKLDPTKCILVGDQTTDKTCAERAGLKYVDQGVFF